MIEPSTILSASSNQIRDNGYTGYSHVCAAAEVVARHQQAELTSFRMIGTIFPETTEPGYRFYEETKRYEQEVEAVEVWLVPPMHVIVSDEPLDDAVAFCNAWNHVFVTLVCRIVSALRCGIVASGGLVKDIARDNDTTLYDQLRIPIRENGL
jgi:hypothetical protein